MKHIFNKRSFHFCLKSLSPFSNPNPNFPIYIQQTRLIRTITPLISNPRCFNGVSHRTLSTRLSEPDNKPNNKPILLPGCDLMHWLVVVDQPDLNLTRDEIIDGYIKTLITVVASEEEARMKIYSVSTKHYFAFGALVSEELAYKLKELPHVRWVLPDSYLDVKNQTYAGEPFINGQAVPYDPKYHAIWLRNHEESLKTNMRNKRKQIDPNSSRLRQNSPTSAFQNRAPHSSQGQNHSIPSNQASIPSQMPKQTPNQSLEPGLRYRNAQNGNLYNDLPPSLSGNNRPSYMGNSNFQVGDPHNHYKNTPHDVTPNYQPNQSSYRNTLSSNSMVSRHGSWNDQMYDSTPSHDVNSGYQGQDVSSHNVNPSFQGQDIPSRYENPDLYGQNTAYHNLNRGFQGRDMLSHNTNPGFQGRDVSSHNVNQGFQEQEMTYPHHHSDYSYRGFSGDVQNGNYHDGYLSTVPQHRQPQTGYVELQSSNTTVPDDFHIGTSPPQQQQSTYVEFRSSNNDHNMNANMMPHVQNHYRGGNTSEPIQDYEYRHDLRQGDKQVDDDNEGTLSGTLQPRDYQERDVASDD